MNPFIYALCEYLADRTSLTFGMGDSTLKIGELPRDVDGVYAIDEPTIRPDRETPIKYANIGFWARYRNSADAYEVMDEIYRVLDRMYEFQIGNTTTYYVYKSFCEGAAEDQDRDSEGGKLIKLSVFFIHRPLDNIS